MAKSYNQKLKILCLMDFLLRETDSEHVVSMKQILEEMEKNGIPAARKSVYNDLFMLKEYGMDIEYRKEKPEGYFLASRTFELPELKLLVDAVQASRFITEKKSRSLIGKIEGLSSRYEAGCLQRQVYVADRVKTMNESIYYNVDKIYSAISEDAKISFQYMRWTVTGKQEKKLSLLGNGKDYEISPWALSWTQDNYYLIGYDSKSDLIKHFRVDKMDDIDILDERREGKEKFGNFDLAEYSKKMFGMFSGEEEIVRIRFPENLLGVIVDRFGKEVPIREDEKGYYIARIKVFVSEQFFGWLTGLGKSVIILSPENVRREYQSFLEAILKVYS
ncbi:MAG: helix-turn-helix transcriptional regulator [Lachnospiraceae bacterium]